MIKIIKWTTKKDAVSRMYNNEPLKEILKIEPRLQGIIKEAEAQRNTSGYNRLQKYVELKNKISSLVGWLAENEKLKSSNSYDIVMETITDLLPPDVIDSNK